MRRTNLRVFRTKHRLTQFEIADLIPCARATYQAIETGRRSGRQEFWHDLQTVFNIPSADMFDLMKIDDEE